MLFLNESREVSWTVAEFIIINIHYWRGPFLFSSCSIMIE